MINFQDGFCEQIFLLNSEITPLLGLNLYESIGKELAFVFSVGGFTGRGAFFFL